tara:strand:+ start:108 stop:356 length:249 start_codon:yes stop_codon:yes gene_type:complete
MLSFSLKNAGSSGVFLYHQKSLNADCTRENARLNRRKYHCVKRYIRRKKISPVKTGLKSGDKDPYVRTFVLILVCNTNVIQV